MEKTVEMYQLLIDSLHDYALFMINPEGVIQTWSKGAEASKLYNEEEIVGKHFSIFYTQEDLMSKKPYKELENARLHGISEDEYWRVRKDGSRFWCYVRICPIMKDGVLIGYSKLTRDLSEKKSVDVIKETNRVKNQFLAQMSHEIRTPMNGVISAANLLNQTDTTKEQSELVGIILESGSVLLKVVNDILDFTKMESNEVRLFDEYFDFYNEVSKITHHFELSMKREVTFSKEIEKDVPRYVQGDPFRFRQVLTNLIDNAVKFTAEGSVTVKISCVRDFNNESAMIKVQVIDTGIGISESDRDKLFIPYQQLDVTSRKRFKGTGLGLSICKYLTSLMKGRLGVESNQKGGSIFWFTVYFNITDLEHVKNAPIKEIYLVPPKFPNAKILIVDDNAINLNVAVRILKKIGYQFLETANDGQEAVEKVKCNHFDLVIMDIQMPILDGYEATKQIRISNPAVPIIAMTANALVGDAEKCLEAGMNDYIPKPLDMTLLTIALNRWVYGSF